MRPCLRLPPSAFLALVLVAPAFGGAPARTDALGDPLPDGALMRLGTARFRGAPPQHGAQLSPDGKWIAVVAPDLTIRLLDAADGTERRRIAVDPRGASAIAFTPAGDVLAAASFGNAVYFWDVATGKPLGRIDVRPTGIHSFALSADGKRVFLVPEPSKDSAVIRGYEVPGGKEIGAYKSVHSYVTGVAVGADGKRFASWGTTFAGAAGDQTEWAKLSRKVQIWDAESGKELRRVETDRNPVCAAAFSPDGKILALAAEGGAIQFWDPTEGKLVRSFQGRLAYGLSLTFTPDGRTLYAAGLDGRIQAWEVETGRRASLAEGQPGRVCCLAFPPGGSALACSQDGQELIVWDVASGKAAAARAGHAAAVAAVAFTPDGKTLLSAGADGLLMCWDAATGKPLARLPESFGENDFRRHAAPQHLWSCFSADGRLLLSGGSNFAAMRETAGGKEELAFPVPAFVGTGLGAPVAFAPDGSVVAVAEGAGPSADGPGVQVWDPNSGRKLNRLNNYKGLAAALAISADGKQLALALFQNPPGPGEWNEVLVWPLAEGKEPRTLKRYGRPGQGVTSLAYSPDGRVLAVADQSGGLAVWDAATAEDRWQAPPANERAAAPAVFSPDGRLLAAAAQGPKPEEGIIRLWEVASGKVRREFSGRFGPVTSLAFSPDSRVLASGCQDTTILLWDATGARIAEAELKRSLKPDALDALWADLASADAAAAGRAVAQLAAAPADAVPFLKKRVRPVAGKAPDAANIAKLVADLTADDFAVREKAEHDLAEIGAAAAPALRQALEVASSAELTKRAGRLLDALAKPGLSDEALRLRRAVEALERAGTPEAREWLAELAKGRAEADLTEDARAAVKRLAGGTAKAP